MASREREPQDPRVVAIELPIGGMTCASCAARVEKRLNRVDGVSATVNYATGRASVRAPADLDPGVLVAEVERTGYTATLPQPRASDDLDSRDADDAGSGDSDELAGLRRRVVVAAALSAPVAAISMVPPLHFPGWQVVVLLLAAPVVLWAGLTFHRAAWVNLRHGAATMDTLVSLGTLVAFAWSVAAVVGQGHMYAEVAAVVTTVVLLGRYLERGATRRAGAAVRALLELGAKDVAVLRDGVPHRVPIARLAVDDEFVVAPGERIATDGVVTGGRSAVDTSTVTGESIPVEVAAGDPVTGATINVGGRLVVRATRVGADTQLAQMARLVEQAQSGKAEVQRLADRVSGVFVPVVIVIAVATLVGWFLAGQPATGAVSAAVAVLIIACPCALGLATPTALLVGTGRGAQLGILIRGPQVLESTRRIDTVVLDKTGTLTTGRMEVHAVVPAPGQDAEELLRVAGALEAASEHPVARAVARRAQEGSGPLPEPVDFANIEGRGVRGRVEGREVLVGRASLLTDEGVSVDPAVARALWTAEDEGRTAVAVAWDGRARGVLVVADTVRPTSAAAVASLRRLGLTPVLVTGDNEVVARRVAADVGIDEVVAGALPAEKVDVVARLQRQGRVVAVVGDGVNDAPALARADLGMAMGSGTDIAVAAADLTLVRGDLAVVPDAIRLARRTLGTIRGNLFWAFAYNVAAIPLAAAGLLSPMVAGAAMAFSSVFVVGNSLRLRRFEGSAS